MAEKVNSALDNITAVFNNLFISNFMPIIFSNNFSKSSLEIGENDNNHSDNTYKLINPIKKS